MREKLELNVNWFYKSSFSEEEIALENLTEYSNISLPHTNVEVPYNYFDDKVYQFISTYKKELIISEAYRDKRIFIDFEGVMTYCKIYFNGTYIGEHKGGFTPFSIEITEHVKFNTKNSLTVMVDSTERNDIPPFGGTLDYMTFGGIYREVYLRIVEKNFIEDIFITCDNPLESNKTMNFDIKFAEKIETESTVRVNLYDKADLICTKDFLCTSQNEKLKIENLENIELWDTEDPKLYRVEVILISETNEVDKLVIPFGFRKAEFKDTGFYLNGKLLKLIGLNRHQSYPYLGYAMPKRGQRKDADLLKEYGLNMVRTSHYPQSRHFLDRCDEIGLLVFEEIPGWQFIGDENWQKQVLVDVKDMIVRDRNRPSVVIWGVRINESGDNHDLYTKTNNLSRELDPTRATGGVRFITGSEFLEDVYTMNDFIHDGGIKDFLRKNVNNFSTYDDTPDIDGAKVYLRNQKQVTGKENPVPYLVTEYAGHMFPTKKSDSEEKLNEHAIRHAKILDAMYGDENISGAIGWCAFDYNTHKDFGAGDKICYHGVMDMFRLPKYAAFAYKSQKNPKIEPVLEPATLWSRGERSISGVMPLTVFTNCDYIRFYYGDDLFGEFKPEREKYPNLPYAPVVVSEPIGFWGSAWENARFEGYVDGIKVIEKSYSNNCVPTSLSLVADDSMLEASTPDITRVVIKVLDDHGNPMMFTQEVVEVEVKGAGTLVGPKLLPLYGGSTAIWIKTVGEKGKISLKVKSPRLNEQHLDIEVL